MRNLILLSVSIFILACSPKVSEVGKTSDTVMDSQMELYKAEIATKRQDRLAKLMSPQGWLSVVGLYWFDQGINTIGATADNKILFPSITTETIGAYQVAGDEIFFGKVEGVDVRSQGAEFMGGPVDVSWPPTVLNHGPLYWYVLKRGDKYGIRLKDTTATNRTSFKGLEYFDISNKYKIEARVLEPQSTDSVKVTNVLGQVRNYPVAAFLNFELAEKVYDLVAFDEGGDNYFVVFDDLTSGVETYGGGRFLYPKKPCDSCEQVTLLDFNLAESPPCAFTDFATCPLPPISNKLNFRVQSGEKSASSH